MFRLISKYAKNWIIKIIFGALISAFIFSWSVTSYFYSQQLSAIKINNESISFNQFQDEVNRLIKIYRTQFGSQYDIISQQLNIKEQALNRLINRILLYQSTKNIGILINNEEIQTEIINNPTFFTNGQFDFNRYKIILTNNMLNYKVFEEYLRKKLAYNRLITLIISTAQITNLEIQQELEQYLNQIQGIYLELKPDFFFSKTKTCSNEIVNWYLKNEKKFLVPERIYFSYLFFPIIDYQKEIQIPHDFIAKIYERERDQYIEPENVVVKHILVEIKSQSSKIEEEAAKTKAEKILFLAKNTKEKFETLAKKYFYKSTLIKGDNEKILIRKGTPSLFGEIIFNYNPGEIGLIKTDLGWHIFKIEEHNQTRLLSLKEVEKKIRSKIIKEEAEKLAKNNVNFIYNEVNNGKNLNELIERYNLNLYKSPILLLNKKSSIFSINNSKELLEKIKRLNPGEITTPIIFNGGYYLAILDKKIPEYINPIKNVWNKVADEINIEKKSNLINIEAQKLIYVIINEIKNNSIDFIVDKYGFKYTNWLNKNNEIPGLSDSYKLVKKLFFHPINNPLLLNPFYINNKLIIAGIIGRRQTLINNIEKEYYQKQLYQRLLYKKRQDFFSIFRSILKNKANIEVSKKI